MRDTNGVWGGWATLALGALLGYTVVAVQLSVALAYHLIESRDRPGLRISEWVSRIASDGLLLALATCSGAIVALLVTIGFIRLRRGLPVRRYLALEPVRVTTVIRWVIVALIVVVTSDVISSFLQRPIVPDTMRDALASARSIPLIWLAVVVAAPVYEELIVRGFLFAGWERSAIGPIGAVLATSFLWSAAHLQYDAYGVGTVFVLGLLLGWIRLRTGSTYACIAVHAAINLVAMVQLIVYRSQMTPS